MDPVYDTHKSRSVNISTGYDDDPDIYTYTFQPGDAVVLEGLKEKDCNGMVGYIVEVHPRWRRFDVKLANTKGFHDWATVSAKEQNIKPY